MQSSRLSTKRARSPAVIADSALGAKSLDLAGDQLDGSCVSREHEPELGPEPPQMPGFLLLDQEGKCDLWFEE